MSIPKTHRRVVLVRRPPGEPAETDFRGEEAPVPEPRHGEVLVKVHYLSLDPYQRGRMRDAASYAAPVGLGEVMTGGIVGEVVKSQHAGFKVGDIVEDRLVGMKSRGVYETPGGTLLYTAHSELEMLVLDRRTLAAKDLIAPRYADLVYEGRWWTTEREAYDAFVNATQGRVTGSITLRLCRGTVTIAGRQSAHALYDERFVTFGEDDVFEQSDAAGFIRLFGLAARVRALKDMEAAGDANAASASKIKNARTPKPGELTNA